MPQGTKQEIKLSALGELIEFNINKEKHYIHHKYKTYDKLSEDIPIFDYYNSHSYSDYPRGTFKKGFQPETRNEANILITKRVKVKID